ncbi:MAG: hypothetical protein K0S38_236 [Candidatus Paceibacter sp.]|jgi:hypothetical protein|nr:hypothetical protein [Candidatus Paceibacter sp.]
MASLNEILKIAGNLENAETMARDMVRKDQQFMLDLELILSARGKFDESRKIINYLSEQFPDDNRIAFNRAWHELYSGDLQKGIELLDRGRPIEVFGSKPLIGKPMWDGKEAKDKTILLRSEGGLGDEIINVRFATDIAKKVGTVIVSCDKSLVTLFSRVSGVSQVVSHEQLKPDMYDAWVPAMSAARICGHTFKTLPSEKYIEALSEKIEAWSKEVTAEKGIMKIGIRWSGNPDFEHERFRRFPAELMLNLQNIPNVKLFSLQRDSDLKNLPSTIIDLGPKLATWEDTAAAIANLDLVITSCTSVAHLAGAMGKKTWVITPIMPYYLWAMPGTKSPWYKSVTLFRQKDERDWNAPFDEIRATLLAGISSSMMSQMNIASQKPINQKKTLHFVAGLPRAGSTMLISLLAQNPSIYGAPVSGLCGIINGVNANWDKIEFHREVPHEAAKISTLRAMLDNYHNETDRPIVLDKDRHWVRYIALLEKLLERPVKIIVPVRPVTEILSSFEVLRQKNPLSFTAVDEQLAERSTLASRCEYFMVDSGPVGSCYNYIRDAVISGFQDRLLFIDYNKFIMNPERDIKRIYDFLELPYFIHDLKNIPQLIQPDDSVWRYPGLHTVRSEVQRTSPEPIQVLGAELVGRYSRVEPWEQWT